MKNLLIMAFVGTLFIDVEIRAQELKQGEQKEETSAPAKKAAEPMKTDTMKCCEGMEKKGEMKAGMPMKEDMKVKMEKMKEMKQKMAEKMSDKGAKLPEPESKVEKNDSSKDSHQH